MESITSSLKKTKEVEIVTVDYRRGYRLTFKTSKLCCYNIMEINMP